MERETTGSIEDNFVLSRWLSYGYTGLAVIGGILVLIPWVAMEWGILLLAVAALVYANANQFAAEADRQERAAEIAGLEARLDELERERS